MFRNMTDEEREAWKFPRTKSIALIVLRLTCILIVLCGLGLLVAATNAPVYVEPWVRTMTVVMSVFVVFFAGAIYHVLSD